MNDETKIKYELAKIYEYVNQILSICKRYNNDYNQIADDLLSYNETLMLIIQLGERAVHIRESNYDFFETCPLQLHDVVNLRNRVTHGYTRIRKELYIDVLKNDMPYFKKYIESEVIQEVLEDPYCLYEEEYEEVIERIDEYKRISQKNEHDR